MLVMVLASCGAGDDGRTPRSTGARADDGPMLVLIADSPRARVGRDYRLQFRTAGAWTRGAADLSGETFDPFMARVGGYQVNLLQPVTEAGATGVTVRLPESGDAMIGCSSVPRPLAGVLVHRHAKCLFLVGHDDLEVPASSAALSNRLGLRLEIVPMVDPLPLLPGDSLPVQVRFDGPALAGATIALQWTKGPGAEPTAVFSGTADPVGSLDLPIEKPGQYLVTVRHEHQPAGGAPEVHLASLTFPIGVRR